MIHDAYMQRCLDLAIQGLGKVAPNPMVGSVVVHKDVIIGEGYHRQYGQAHAEVNAINSVVDKSLLAQSTLYVNLEPCSHHGKTPPCADLIVEHKIPRVVIGSGDPNPLVAGKGVERLRKAGVEVTEGVLHEACEFLNRRFFMYHRRQRPYVILKWAQSSDGYMAPEGDEQYWLTGEQSKQLVHQWRTQEQAVLVGTRTALIDNPQLTARLWQGTQPLRVVLDKDLKLPAHLHLLDGSVATVVFNGFTNDSQPNLERVKVDFTASIEAQVLHELYKRGIASLLIEGGALLLNSFIKLGLWDEARIFTAPVNLQRGKQVLPVQGKVLETCSIGNDMLQLIQNTRA